MPQKSRFFLSLVFLIGGMIALYVGAAIAKWLFVQISAQGTVVLRLGISALILCAVMRPLRGAKITKKNIAPLFLYGGSLGIMNFLFYLSLQTLPIGIAVTLEFTGPLTLALIFARKPLDFVWVILAILGVYLLMPNQNHNDLDTKGVIYALSAGAAWALYILFGHKAGELHGIRVAPLGTAIAALVVMPLGLPHLLPNLATLFTWQVMLAAILMALLSSSIPYTAEMYALTKMPARTFSILMSLEPALGAIIGLLLLGEQLNLWQWLAVIAIMIASSGAAISIRKI